MPLDPMPSIPAAPSAAGDVRSAISDGLVALLKEYYGRGPDKAKTYVTDDLVVCLLRGGFTRVEQTLLDGGHGHPPAHGLPRRYAQALRESRRRGHRSPRHRLHVGHQQDPDMICEVFVLAANDVLG
jgi:hypothetical protein